jgi:hypothetical protein
VRLRRYSDYCPTGANPSYAKSFFLLLRAPATNRSLTAPVIQAVSDLLLAHPAWFGSDWLDALDKNRHVERVFNPNRKEHHWGKRKLERAQ